MKITMQCQNCGQELLKTLTPSHANDGGHGRNPGAYEVHKRCVTAFSTTGTGYGRYRMFTMMMNTPTMSEHSYVMESNKVSAATKEAGELSLQEVVCLAREKYMTMDPTLTTDSIIDVAVSFDGTLTIFSKLRSAVKLNLL